MKRVHMKVYRLRRPMRGIQSHYLLRVFAVLMSIGTIWSCSYLKPIDDPTGSQRTAPKKSPITPVYHDFDDILVPKAMRINRKMTALTENETMLAGVLAFEGKLEREELIRFFKNNMAKDNWTSLAKLIGQRSVLHFEKHNRWCLLTITDRPGGFGTRLDIWVIPKNDAVSSGLLK